jgi:hypothetical protein
VIVVPAQAVGLVGFAAGLALPALERRALLLEAALAACDVLISSNICFGARVCFRRPAMQALA